jgi:hypothetical protein
VQWLRGYTASEKYQAASVALEQAMLADAVLMSAGGAASDDLHGDSEVMTILKEALQEVQESLQECFKVVVGFLQVNGSFLLTFGSIDFPYEFTQIAGTLSGIFSLDMINAELFGTSIPSLNFCNSEPHQPHLNRLRSNLGTLNVALVIETVGTRRRSGTRRHKHIVRRDGRRAGGVGFYPLVQR